MINEPTKKESNFLFQFFPLIFQLFLLLLVLYFVLLTIPFLPLLLSLPFRFFFQFVIL